jgi:hypothetical protein
MSLSGPCSPATTAILAAQHHKGDILLFILLAYLSDSVLKCAVTTLNLIFEKTCLICQYFHAIPAVQKSSGFFHCFDGDSQWM